MHTQQLLNYLPAKYILMIPRDLVHFCETLSWPQVLAVVTAPVCAFKQFVNFVQFGKAAMALADLDREERYQQLHEKKQ